MQGGIILEKLFFDRISEGTTEGILAFSTSGEIMYMNRSAKELLDISEIEEGKKITDFFKEDSLNDKGSFKQSVLDTLDNKTKRHSNRVQYITPSGVQHYFSVTSSSFSNGEGKVGEGFVLYFTDVTKEALYEQRLKTSRAALVAHAFYEKKFRDTSLVFFHVLSTSCLWIIFYSCLRFFQIQIGAWWLLWSEGIIILTSCILILKHTSLTIEDIKNSLKVNIKYILIDTAFAMGALTLIILYKFIVGYEGSFWHFENLTILNIFYPITVVFQEVLARSIIQESITRVMPSRHGEYRAIWISSLYFGALHVHKGFPFIIGSAFLMAIFGLVYSKQKNIWGCCIPHYVLGMSLPMILGYD